MAAAPAAPASAIATSIAVQANSGGRGVGLSSLAQARPGPVALGAASSPLPVVSLTPQRIPKIPSHGGRLTLLGRQGCGGAQGVHRAGGAGRCARAEAGEGAMGTGSDTKDVVEHVMLFKMPVQLPLEQEQELLDHLYTLQYHYRHILCTSLGRVFSKVSDGYTHGAVIRLPSRDTLAAFLAHPMLKEYLEKYVDPFCEGRLSLSFEAKVENDLEALFRRGENFESGIEHLVFVKPKEGATPEQQEGMLEAVRQLPQKVGPAVVQLTAGTILESDQDSGFQHALIVRVLSEEDLTTYNKHPAHREVIRKHLLPMASKILSVDFSVDPVGNERPAI